MYLNEPISKTNSRILPKPPMWGVCWACSDVTQLCTHLTEALRVGRLPITHVRWPVLTQPKPKATLRALSSAYIDAKKLPKCSPENPDSAEGRSEGLGTRELGAKNGGSAVEFFIVPLDGMTVSTRD